MKRQNTVISVDIDLSDINEGDLLGYIQMNYSPDDVFPKDELAEWATENGFAKTDA